MTNSSAVELPALNPQTHPTEQPANDPSGTSFLENNGLPSTKNLSPKYKNTCRMFGHVCTLCLGMFLFGYCLAYHSAVPILMTMQIFNITTMNASGAMALLSGILPIAAALGAWLFGPLSGWLSRRYSVIFTACWSLLGTVLVMIDTFPTIIIGRIVQGICVGIFTSLIPMFINQISPLQLTGTFGTFSSTFIAAGIVTTNILAIFVNDWDPLFPVVSNIWRLVYGFPLITGTLQIILLLTVFKQQPPRYLLEKGREEEAREFIQKYYEPEFVEQVLAEKKAEAFPAGNKAEVSINVQDKPVEVQTYGTKSKHLRNYVAIHLSMLQQLSGINIVIIYGIGIINQAMNSSLNAKILQLFSVVIEALGSLSSAYLLKRVGRKALFQLGTAVSCVFMLLICIGFLALPDQTTGQQALIIVSLFIFMFDFGMTLGPVVFLYIPEIVDPVVISYASMVNWLACGATLILFPIIGEYLRIGFLFLFLSVWCLVSLVINHKCIVETRNKAEREIRQEYDELVAKKE